MEQERCILQEDLCPISPPVKSSGMNIKIKKTQFQTIFLPGVNTNVSVKLPLITPVGNGIPVGAKISGLKCPEGHNMKMSASYI
jgi:hypothetical protein